MTVGEAQRLRELEDENSRLKKLVADLSLDKQMLASLDCLTNRHGSLD